MISLFDRDDFEVFFSERIKSIYPGWFRAVYMFEDMGRTIQHGISGLHYFDNW